jgi:hypothetical protein
MVDKLMFNSNELTWLFTMNEKQDNIVINISRVRSWINIIAILGKYSLFLNILKVVSIGQKQRLWELQNFA